MFLLNSIGTPESTYINQGNVGMANTFIITTNSFIIVVISVVMVVLEFMVVVVLLLVIALVFIVNIVIIHYSCQRYCNYYYYPPFKTFVKLSVKFSEFSRDSTLTL